MRLPSPAASTIAVPGMSTAGLGLSASGRRNRLMLFPSTPLPVPKRADWHRTIAGPGRSEEHTSELQSLMRISYAVFCLKKKLANEYTDQTTTKTEYTM